MADANNSSTTSGASGAGDDKGGTPNRKIGGKYNSVEDAVEELIKSRDEAFHETRQELGAMKQLLERALTPIGSRGSNNGYDRDDDYNRGRSNRNDDPEDEIDAGEFLSTPGKILKRREAKLIAAMERRHTEITAAAVNNAAAVIRFQQKNPDLDDHEDLVQSFLQKTNRNDPLNKRLTEAGKATKAYLKKLRGTANDEDDEEGDAGRAPNSDEYVGGPAGGRDGNRRQGKGNDDGDEGEGKELTGDEDMAAYLQERRQFRTARFQAPKK